MERRYAIESKINLVKDRKETFNTSVLFAAAFLEFYCCVTKVTFQFRINWQ